MFTLPPDLEKQIAEIITHYPSNRAPMLWLLHLLQDHYGFLGPEQIEWTAKKLGVRNIDVAEVVSFYPMFTTTPRGKNHIKVCRTLSCELCGCKKVSEHITKKLGIGLEETTPDGQFTVSTVECLAACDEGPVMMINDELYTKLTPEKIDAILDRVKREGLKQETLPPVSPAHPQEKRVILANVSKPGYRGTIDDYIAAGGYEMLKKALEMQPAAIGAEVEASKLRGRGGAGFPCGMKWKFVDRKSGKPVYLICNADESEPGTFKDRVILHHDPHQLIEGVLISAFAIGCKTAYIYLRGEFPYGEKIVRRAIDEARAKGLVGKNILGKGFDCEIYTHRGAGAYVCGEETGLIESLEGKRAYPRIKPPFPAIQGLFNCPTVVNNVETLCNVVHIVRMGGAEYAKVGVPGSSGTRIVCVSGAVKNPGYFEFEMGKLTLRQLIFDICGGMKEGRTLKGVIPGGSSMPVMLPEQLDVTLDFDAIQKAGSYAGSGGVIVLDNETSIVAAAANLAQFYAHESCGQCTPCREGSLWLEKLLHRVQHGGGRKEDVDLLFDIADNIDGKTICALGEASAWPQKAFVTKFRKEFEQACSKNGGHS